MLAMKPIDVVRKIYRDFAAGDAAAIETADAVIVEGRYTGLYKPTGRRMDLQVCHVWRFRGGEVTSFHQYLDTASLQRVMGRE
jgi:ketosteroid isomerase-like protein